MPEPRAGRLPALTVVPMLLVAAAALLPAPAAAAPAGEDHAGGITSRVGVSSREVQGDQGAGLTAVSGGGRYVAFDSWSENLVPGDTNGTSDVFVRDRDNGRTSRISVSSTGAQSDDGSFSPSISADGRYVMFTSWASNLVPGDTNGTADAFVRDRHNGRTSRVTVRGAAGQGDGASIGTAISADGRYVTFTSDATNLVPGDTNGFTDAFVRDRYAGTTTRISVSSGGGQADNASFDPHVSTDGRYVAFSSYATNLAATDGDDFSDVFLRDRVTGRTTLVSRAPGGGAADEYSTSATISGNGRYVAFWSFASNVVPGDTNNSGDIYVWDRVTVTVARVSVSSGGAQANSGSHRVAINADGRYVAFTSTASNLVRGDTNGVGDVFVRDRVAAKTIRVSVSTAGTQGNADSSSNPIAISPGGRHIGFTSEAGNLVPGDTNNVEDAFVHSLAPR